MAAAASSFDSNATSGSLLQRARSHDPTAWRQLCRIYGPLVYRWARKAGLQDSDAADVGQEVFRTVAARLGDFDYGQPGATFRGWLWTIARHKIGDYLRRRAAQPAAQGGTDAHQLLHQLPELPAEATDAAERVEVEAGLMLRALHAVQAEFEPSTRQAFWRVTVDGQPTDGVAAELGLSREAVRQAKHRVRRRLKQALADL